MTNNSSISFGLKEIIIIIIGIHWFICICAITLVWGVNIENKIRTWRYDEYWKFRETPERHDC